MVKEVPITQQNLTIQGRIPEVEFSTGAVRLKERQAEILLNKAEKIQARALDNAYGQAQNTLAAEIARMEREYANRPDDLSEALQNYRDSFLSEISDSRVSERIALQFDRSSLLAVERAKDGHARIIEDQAMFGALQSAESIERELSLVSGDILSANPAVQAAALGSMQEIIDRGVGLFSQRKADGTPLFSAEHRFSAISQMKDTALVGGLTKYLASQGDKDAALKRILSGDIKINLPDGTGGVESIQISQALSPKAVEVIKAEAKRQKEQQEADLKDAQELPLAVQIENQTAVMALLENPAVSVQEKSQIINMMDLRGEIRDEFATEVRTVLSGKKAEGIPDTVKLQSFNSLSDMRQNLWISLTGNADAEGEIKLNSKNIENFKKFQTEVFKELAAGRIEEGEAKTLLKDITEGVTIAIQDRKTKPAAARIRPGIQDPHNYGLRQIEKYLKAKGQEANIVAKKALYMAYIDNLGTIDEKGVLVPSGAFESTGNKAKDEAALNASLNAALKGININNFIGQIDIENPPNYLVQPARPAPKIGEIRGNRRFTGGNPADPKNWPEVE